jgi:hypothetical protein
MIALWLMLACTGQIGGADESAGDGGGDDGGGSNADAPTIVSFDVYCCNPASGAEAWYWSLTAQVTDPQGASTIAGSGPESGHQVNVMGSSGGAPIAEYGSGFHCDDKGVCSASWQQAWDNIYCSSADSYLIELIVADEDGNLSHPEELPGVKNQSRCD